MFPPDLGRSAILSFAPQTKYTYIKPKEQIRTYGAEDVFELLNSHDKEHTLDSLVEIRKQSDLEEAEEPEPETKERTMTISKRTEGLGLTEAGIKTFEDIDSKEQPAATIRQGIARKKKFRRRRICLCLERFQCLVF
jgi:hypothetical protein